MPGRRKKRSKDELKLMADALEQSGEAIVLADRACRFLYVNPAFSELFGYSAEELLGKDMSVLVPQPAPGGGKAPAPPSEFHGQGLRRAKGGQDIPVMLHITPLKAEDGKAIGFVGTLTDLSDVKRTEERLRLVTSVFDNAYDGVIVTDAQANILHVNPAFTRITGYSREEVIGKNPRLLQSGRQSPEFYAAMWERLLRSGYFRGELWNRRKDGSIYAELITIFAIRDETGVTRQYLGIFNDITNLKIQSKELERLAHLDPLTGLPNRLLLADRLVQAIAQARRNNKSFAVCFVDLDGFKAINDAYGHHVGDEVLIEIARRLGECVREGDTIARLGGDEFVVLLTNLEDGADCERTLRRLMAVTASPVAVAGHRLRISMSIGVTLFPKDSDDADTLLRRADQTMYAAKQRGKNCYRFFSGPTAPSEPGS